MPPDKRKSLATDERKDVFLALVKAQDEGDATVLQSRKNIAKEFGITEREVKKIEEEGIDGNWPPLG